MAKLDDDKILKIINTELSASVGGSENDSIEMNRRKAMSTYLGDAGEVDDGKSSVVSTDVADAIEWIMPEVVKAFTQNNEVVTFDPVSANDRSQAEMESRFVYDVLMKDNNGFIVIHNFVKDALMQKNGFIKVFYDDKSEVTKEDYTGLTEPEVLMLQSDPEIEITGLTEEVFETENNSMTVFNVNCTRRHFDGKVSVIPVAPEDFRVNRMHNSPDVSTARFCAHTFLKTKSDLLEDGFDKKIIEELPSDNMELREQQLYRFSMMGETTQIDINTGDDSQTLYEVSECYIRIDIDGDGIAERCKITVAGINNATHILEIEEVDSWPFISATAIMMSHKLFGLSIYDRLKEIQAQKTALWRNILDNMYLQNNQRTIVIEGQANLDDLLISRPGGIIRAKTPNAVQPYTTPPLSGDAYRMMDYLDQVRAGRSGVSPEGSIHDSAMGDNVGSQGLDRLLTQKEELVGLMIRVFAETGIKPLCNRIRDLLVQHVDVIQHYEFHGEWQQVVPSKWIARTKSTVRVGTGSGNRKEQAAALMQVLGFQEKILQNPAQALVSEQQVFAALNDFAKFSGMPGAGAYFLDPNSPEGQQNKKQVDEQQQQSQEAELKEKQLLATTQESLAKAETIKAEAAQQSVQLKAELENQKQMHELQKAEWSSQMEALKQQLAEAKTLGDQDIAREKIAHAYYQTDVTANVAYAQMDMNKQITNSGEDVNDKRNSSEAGD